MTTQFESAVADSPGPRRFALSAQALAWICSLAALMGECSFEPGTPEDDLIVPGVRVGAVTSATTETELQRIYGADQVRPFEVHVGEGFTEEGAELFLDDPRRRLQVVWKDDAEARTPRSIYVLGSAWRTEEGIGLGTSLRELERLNEGSFQLTGFSWDYSGTVLSWNGGRLESRLGRERGVVIRLAPEDGEGDPRVDGDSSFPSDHPAMQALDPVVYAFVLEFE